MRKRKKEQPKHFYHDFEISDFNAELNEFKENPGEQKKELVKSEPERSSDTQGYQNLTYNDLEKSEKLDVFNEGDGEKVDDEFSEIKL